MRQWLANTSPLWRINFAIVLIFAAVIIALRFFASGGLPGDGEGCAIDETAEYVDIEEETALVVRDEFPLEFAWIFGSDRAWDKDETIMDWNLPDERPPSVAIGDQLELIFPGDLESNDGDSIPDDQISATAVATGNGVRLSVCVDTTGVAPDRYQGIVTFVDSELTVSPLPIDVVVKHRDEWVPLSAMVAGLGIALLILVFTLADEGALKPARVVGIALVALFAGGLASRPWDSWLDNPTWGSGRDDAWLLIVATALAATGAMVGTANLPALKKWTEGKDGSSAENRAAADGADGSPTTDGDDMSAPDDDATVESDGQEG